MSGDRPFKEERETLAEREPLVPRTEPLSGPSLQHALERGATLGRYVVIEKLGSGGMGDVYAAYDRTLDRKIALKLPRDDGPSHRLLSVAEAHAMAKLSHPNVVAVFDAGVVDGRPYIAMEFVQGRTLRRWQRETRPAWRDVIRAYVDAGRGLHAAHAAGMVHGDFKPSNVLIADDGQVKVTDFGLSHPVGDARSSSTSTSTSSPSGGRAVAGTPGYMAPELKRGLEADPRSDQYSFCVALFEALHGHKPGEEADARERPSAPIPGFMRRAVQRGLAADPTARFPSMRDLLDVLGRDPAGRRNLWIASAGALLVAAAALFGRHEIVARRAELCTGGEAEARETWNDGVRQRIEQALLGTGVPYAQDTWRRTSDRIDAYMARWKALHRSTCEATRIRGEQSEKLMALRMECLEQRRQEVSALTRVLETADRDVAGKAVQAASELTRLDTCEAIGSTSDVAPEPTDPASRAELSAIRAGLSEAKTNLDAGRGVVAREQVGPLVVRARALGFLPNLAETLLLSARAKADSGGWSDAVGDGLDAAAAAEAGRDDMRRLMAQIDLVSWLTETGRVDEAAHWSELAEATLRRTGEDGEQRAEWLDASGWLMYRQGRKADAADRLRSALETARRASSTPQHISKVARALGDVEASLGHYDEAGRLVDDADRTLIDAFGVDHPSRITVLVNRSVIAARANRRHDELEYARKAIALAESVAPDHHALGVAYLDACDALMRLREYDESFDTCQHAIEISRRVYGPGATYVAYADTTTGDVLAGLGRYAESRAYYQEAVAIHERSNTRGDSDYADALRGLGMAALRGGRPREAMALLESALASAPRDAEMSAEDAAIVASIEGLLAQALCAGGTRSGRVQELVQSAASRYRGVGDEEHASEIERARCP
ncbi:MAG TPA: serine/threonine-protein kinase [Polyangiaceae bacterium]